MTIYTLTETTVDNGQIVTRVLATYPTVGEVMDTELVLDIAENEVIEATKARHAKLDAEAQRDRMLTRVDHAEAPPVPHFADLVYSDWHIQPDPTHPDDDDKNDDDDADTPLTVDPK